MVLTIRNEVAFVVMDRKPKKMDNFEFLIFDYSTTPMISTYDVISFKMASCFYPFFY